MHALGHALLSAKPHPVRVMLYNLAIEAKVTVDEVVHAGLKRPASVPAQHAANHILQAIPDAFEGLESWPWTCPRCKSVATARLIKCIACSLPGCTQCMGAECQPCIERRRAASEHLIENADEATSSGTKAVAT